MGPQYLLDLERSVLSCDIKEVKKNVVLPTQRKELSHSQSNMAGFALQYIVQSFLEEGYILHLLLIN